MPLETLDVSSIGTRRALDLARANDAPFLLASTSEIYGDPLVHPQTETYCGNVDPIGPRAVYDEAKRFAETLTMTYHRAVRPADARSCASSTPTARACARPTGGSCRTSSCRRSTGEPLTVYGDGTQTRSFCYVDDEVRGILALFDSDVVEPVNIGNPIEFTMLELAEIVCEVTGVEPRDRVRAAARRRPDPAPARHHARRASCSGGSRRSSCARVSRARTPGTWRSAPVAAL